MTKKHPSEAGARPPRAGLSRFDRGSHVSRRFQVIWAAATIGMALALAVPAGGAQTLEASSREASTTRAAKASTSSVVANAAVAQVPVFDQPNAPAPSRVLSNPTATNGKLAFLVVDLTTTGWVKVLLPVRPNGSTGWVHAQDVVTTPDPYKVVVSLGGHSLTLLKKGKNVLEAPAGIGKGNTPTPGGRYYLAQLYKPPNSKGIYGPFAYALNGYSEVLPDFNGGDPIIGIHGTNQPDLVGQDVSHGCIRVTNDVITKLANLLPLGTPVQIKKK
jgi:lipoprotein-anchoring transpeptidase ErfK/SrfK